MFVEHKSMGSLEGVLIHIGALWHLGGLGGHESVDQADGSSSSSQGLGVAPPHRTTATLLPRFNIPTFPRYTKPTQRIHISDD